MSPHLIKAGLDAIYYSGAHSLLSPLCRGVGAILTMHQVCPARDGAFQPNRILQVTPEFLETVIVTVRERGRDIVSLDEACRRLRVPKRARPFVCLTFDDGYRDNLDHAYPVLKRHRAPFTIYVPTAYPSGRGELWWLALERAITVLDEVHAIVAGRAFVLETDTDAGKCRAFGRLYRQLRQAPEQEQRRAVRALCTAAGIDMAAMCDALIMDWAEIAALARDPLCTIGAHTVHHYGLGKLDEDEARREMADSAAAIAERIGVQPRHFSYPYGDDGSAGPREFELARELGFATAVTTRKGVLHAGHGRYLTALPRVSLNGEYQSRRYVEALLGGVPFMLFNGLKRLNVT